MSISIKSLNPRDENYVENIIQNLVFPLAVQFSLSTIIATSLVVVAAVLLSILSILYFQTRRKLKTARSAQLVTPGMMRNGPVCAKCNTQNAPSARFCRSCGSVLSAPKMVICSNCHEPNSTTARFCRKCGRILK